MPADTTNDLILITCASGKQGTDLVPVLYNHFSRLRLQVKSEASEQRLRTQYPNAEIIRADLHDPAVPAQLLEGVTAATKHEHHIAVTLFTAASTIPTLKHIIYSSVLHPHLYKLLNHAAKLSSETYLIESSLPFTILQPSHVMENLPLRTLLSSSEPTYPIPYNPSTVFTWTSTKDLAFATLRILLEREEHFHATYQLISTAPASYTDAIKIVSEVLGKEVAIKRVGLLEAAETMAQRAGGGSEGAREVARRLLLYYDERGLVGNRNVMRWLLGREPLGYREWVEMRVQEIKADGVFISRKGDGLWQKA
ncbi:hypothetical protein MBLNU457_g0555t2 [Dothideomycetes sp. NU457]